MTDPTTDRSAASGLPDAAELRRGTAYGLAAYLLWGGMPLYFLALRPAAAWEILGQRILWSVAFCLVLLLATRRLRGLLRQLRNWRLLGGCILAGALISVNWLVYLLAATTGRVAEAALGYFLNPLVSIALGMVFLGERLTRLQAVAVAIAALAAAVLVVQTGGVPIIPTLLALSFGLYGLVKKRLGPGLGALESLSVETAAVAPAAMALLVVLALRGEATFGAYGLAHDALLAGAGLVTVVPLLLFGAAARRVPLTTVGLLQFIAPILQFGTALALGERLSAGRWAGFALVWCALALVVADALRRRPRPAPRA